MNTRRFLESELLALLPEIEKYTEMMGKTITVVCGNREIVGKAHGISSSEGALLLLLGDGSQESVWAGDVVRIEGGI